MAVEVVRRHFDPPAEKAWKVRWREGEKAMCSALRVERTSLQALEAVAARSRHGELVFSIDWEMRKRALVRTLPRRPAIPFPCPAYWRRRQPRLARRSGAGARPRPIF